MRRGWWDLQLWTFLLRELLMFLSEVLLKSSDCAPKLSSYILTGKDAETGSAARLHLLLVSGPSESPHAPREFIKLSSR